MGNYFLPIFRSPAQARLLSHLFVLGGEEALSLSALAEISGVSVSTAQREVQRLEEAGLLASKRVGATRLVQPNEESPYYDDLRSLLMKAFGPARLLRGFLSDVRGVESAFLFGSWARRYRGEPGPPPRDIDVLVVGEPDLDSLYEAARQAEDTLRLEVNPIVVSEREWRDSEGLVKRIREQPLVDLNLADAS